MSRITTAALLALLLAACGGGGGDDEPAAVPVVPVVHTANINPQLPPGH